MPFTVYARGKYAKGHCARSGRKMDLMDMVEDPRTGLMVDPDWAEEPDRIPRTYVDGIALYRPAPDLDQPDVSIYLETLVNLSTGRFLGPVALSMSVGNVSVTVS